MSENVDRDSVASHCSCGAAIDGDGWTAERLCQMCWEGYCGDKFWEIAMSVEQMVEQLHQLMAEHCFVQAQELAEDIDADERATPEQRTTAGEYLQQIMRNEEAYSWGYDQ